MHQPQSRGVHTSMASTSVHPSTLELTLRENSYPLTLDPFEFTVERLGELREDGDLDW
jgi:hypothetical protein